MKKFIFLILILGYFSSALAEETSCQQEMCDPNVSNAIVDPESPVQVFVNETGTLMQACQNYSLNIIDFITAISQDRIKAILMQLEQQNLGLAHKKDDPYSLVFEVKVKSTQAEFELTQPMIKSRIDLIFIQALESPIDIPRYQADPETGEASVTLVSESDLVACNRYSSYP